MNLLELAIGWVAPPDCIGCGFEGSVVCQACATSEIVPYGEHCWSCGAVSAGGRTCVRCRRQNSPGSVWITTNYEGLAKTAVQKYKFSQLRAAGTSIAALMVQTLEDFGIREQIKKKEYIVVAVPTATSRRRQRGFDHSQLLAGRIAKILEIKNVAALGRLGQSRQVGAQRSVRKKQITGKYYVRLPHLIKDRNILLIDDVVTTGATLREATKVLRQAGAKRVDALVFAKRL